MSYVELWGQLLRKAVGLSAAGARKGEIVLIFAPQGLEAVTLFFGAMAVGLVPSFMPLPSDRQDPELFWSRHRKLFGNIGRGLALAPARSLPFVEACVAGSDIRALDIAACDGEVSIAPVSVAPRRSEDIALLQHSSGTTGLKKGVALSFAQIEAQIEAYAPAVGLSSDSRVVSWLPLYHDMGLIACLLAPLAIGCETTLLDPFKWAVRPARLWDAVVARRATHIWLPNFAFLHLARAIPEGRRWDFSSLERVVNCSEPCTPAAFDAVIQRWGADGLSTERLACCYAMAETVFAITQTRAGDSARRFVFANENFAEIGCPAHGDANGFALLSSGVPVGGVALKLVDDRGEPVASGCYGEICVSAPFLFAGYPNDPERTRARLRDGWLHTGDIGALIDGELYVCGRLDDMLAINGRNIHALEIERLVGAIDGVIAGRVAALGPFETSIGTRRLVVVAESEIAEDTRKAALRRKIAEAVTTAVGVQPAEVLISARNTIHKTTSGKLDRASTLARYEAGALVSWRSDQDAS